MFMFKFCPKILLLSETRTIIDMSDAELAIDNYNLIRLDSYNRHTGGVAIYLHNSMTYKEVQTFYKH
jgi:hypothetical protein